MNESLLVIPNSSLRVLVADKIREAIATGRFPVGSRLIERELCELMSVSRTSVREAFRELEAEGLITTLPNRGPIVSIVTVEMARSIYEVRAVLEGLAVRLFVQRATEAEIMQLGKTLRRIEELIDDYPSSSFLIATDAFYKLIFDGARNDVAAMMLRGVRARVSQLRATSLSNPIRLRQAMDEMKQLYDAISARDEDRAWRACIGHVENAAMIAIEVLRQQRPGAKQQP